MNDGIAFAPPMEEHNDDADAMSEIMLYPTCWSSEMICLWATDEELDAAVIEALRQLAIAGDDLTELRQISAATSANVTGSCLRRLADELVRVGANDPEELLGPLVSKWRFLLSITDRMTDDENSSANRHFEKAEIAGLQLESESGLAEMQRLLNMREQSTFGGQPKRQGSHFPIIELNPRRSQTEPTSSAIVMNLEASVCSRDKTTEVVEHGCVDREAKVPDVDAATRQLREFFEATFAQLEGDDAVETVLEAARDADSDVDDAEEANAALLRVAVARPREDADEFDAAFATAQRELRYRAPAT